MLTLQEQVVQKLNGLSENNLQFLLDMIKLFTKPESSAIKFAREYKPRPATNFCCKSLVEMVYSV